MDKKEIGKQIKEKREALGFTQNQLAEEVGISYSFMSVIERGVGAPGLDNLIKILNVLDLSADVLLSKELNNGFVARASAYADRLGELPKKERNHVESINNFIIDSFINRK